ncbi:MAG TPA: MATE family efflux transporter, partial [Porticoccaceae bacterium]|nr:MATE family efflux transporter [Porticoccaceae bacterium]
MHAESSNPPAFRRGLGQLVRLALPITVGQLAIVGMSVTDIIVSGWAGTNELAAVSLGSTIFNLSIMLVIGIVLANG